MASVTRDPNANKARAFAQRGAASSGRAAAGGVSGKGSNPLAGVSGSGLTPEDIEAVGPRGFEDQTTFANLFGYASPRAQLGYTAALKGTQAQITQQQHVQDALGTLSQVYGQTGDQKAALSAMIRQHPDALHDLMVGGLIKSPKDIASLFSMGAAGGGVAPSVKDLGNGMSMVTNTDQHGAQRGTLHNNPQAPQGGVVKLQEKDPTTGQMVERAYQRQGNQLVPLQVPGPDGTNSPAQSVKPGKPLTALEERQVTGAADLLASLPGMRQNIEASGSLGVGFLNRMVGEHTPFPSPQARGLIGSLEQARPALGQMFSGPTRLHAGYNDMTGTLPVMGDSEDMNRERMAQTELKAQRNVVSLYDSLKSSGRDTAAVEKIMKDYGIFPDAVHALDSVRAKLTSNPGALSDTEVINVYAKNAFAPDGHFALPRNEGIALMRQMQARGLYDRLPDWGPKAGVDLSRIPSKDAVERNYGPVLQKPLAPQEVPAQSTNRAQDAQRAEMATQVGAALGQEQMPPAMAAQQAANDRGVPLAPEKPAAQPPQVQGTGKPPTGLAAGPQGAPQVPVPQQQPTQPPAPQVAAPPTQAQQLPPLDLPRLGGRPIQLTPPTGQSLAPDETEEE